MKLDFSGLLPHQPQGVTFLAERARAMLAWDMRTCKTSTALRAWECTRDEYPKPALVLCPASARLNWAREARRFALDPAWPPTVQVLTRTDTPIDPQADLIITNYDKLDNKTMLGKLRSRQWGLLINDEAKYLKNPNAERTKMVLGGGRKDQPALISSCARVWELEGTPMPNHPGELWTHCRYLFPEAIMYKGKPMEKWQFELQYCHLRQTDYGMKVVGGKNLHELRDALRPFVQRLKFADVFGPENLPRVDTWPLDLDAFPGMPKIPDLPELVAKLSHEFKTNVSLTNFNQTTLDTFLLAVNAHYDVLASLRRETGTLKAIATTLLVRHELENGAGKTIVFAWHRDAIDTLAKGLAKFNPAILHGGTIDREGEINKFWADTSCKVFIGQIATAGQAIDLSCSNNIVFAEQSWVPGENAQASLRASGPRQESGVSVRFTYLPGSIDEMVTRAIARKSVAIASMFG
jgi:SWI/SNF-related matrix-associated actin-dependent regulator of chromatin subfamily A-like protein 1